MSKLETISIGSKMSIPVDKYNPVKVNVNITHRLEADEEKEEAFAKAYKDLNNIKEAAAALEMEKRNRIENNQGMLNYGYNLLDDLREDVKKFYQAFINLV